MIYDAERNSKITELVDQGFGPTEISRRLNIPHGAVCGVIRRYRKRGGKPNINITPDWHAVAEKMIEEGRKAKRHDREIHAEICRKFKKSKGAVDHVFRKVKFREAPSEPTTAYHMQAEMLRRQIPSVDRRTLTGRLMGDPFPGDNRRQRPEQKQEEQRKISLGGPKL